MGKIAYLSDYRHKNPRKTISQIWCERMATEFLCAVAHGYASTTIVLENDEIVYLDLADVFEVLARRE